MMQNINAVFLVLTLILKCDAYYWELCWSSMVVCPDNAGDEDAYYGTVFIGDADDEYWYAEKSPSVSPTSGVPTTGLTITCSSDCCYTYQSSTFPDIIAISLWDDDWTFDDKLYSFTGSSNFYYGSNYGFVSTYTDCRERVGYTLTNLDSTPYPTYPTPYPTYPTPRPTYPTPRPTYPTPKPTYPSSNPIYPTAYPTIHSSCNVDSLNWIDDNICDTSGGYNTAACDWDGGDCCSATNPDGSNLDDQYCYDPSYSSNTPSPTSKPITCWWSNTTPCPDGSACYYDSDVCDGENDCDDGSDEEECPTSSSSATSSDSSTSAGFVVAIIVFITLSLLCICIFILCVMREKKEPELNESNLASPANIQSDDNMSNTNLISNNYDPTDCDDAGQKNLPCCWYCRPDFSLFCRFKLFYFFYFLSFETGILYITNELADAQLNGGKDDFEVYNAVFLAIAAFICFAFSIFLGKLSDAHGRRRYIRLTVIITTIPFVGVLIYPNIWLYFGLVPLIGFVGATSTLTGLFVTYITDVVPKPYVAAGFAAIQSTEGTAGLFAAMIIGIIGATMDADDYQGALGVVTGIFLFTFLISLCLIGESLPLQKRNLKPDDPTKSKYNFFQIWLDTLKENRLLYIMCIFYFFILFSFAGLEYLIHQKSSFIKLFQDAFDSDTDTDGDGNQYFVWFLCISLGMKVGKSWNPLILCLTGCCFKTMLNKIIFFIVTLIVALLLFASLKAMDGVLFDDLGPIYAMAAVSGIIFAWGKLLLPLINVLVRGSSNKLERGRTFGVLSSIESICNYIAPLTVINLWNGDSNTRILSVIVCFITVIIGSIWLHIKIKPVLIPQTRFDAKSVSANDEGGDIIQYGDTDTYVAPSSAGNTLNVNNLQKDMFDL